jgi:ribonuclease BN (tRNA processing enzyme)
MRRRRDSTLGVAVSTRSLDTPADRRLVSGVLRLRVLGSGDAFNSSGALHSCYLVEGGDGTLMLECGPCSLAAMKRVGVASDVPDAILISHLHGDHFAGIPFLLLEYKYKNPRSRPLVIAGPPTTEARIAELYAALYEDIHTRPLDFPIEYRVLEPGGRTRLAGLDVEAFEVPHSAMPVCLGYRIAAPGASMLFSGDSSWTDEFTRRSRGVDVFLCECCSMEPDAPVHVSYRDVVAHRAALGCKRLLLTHLGEDVRTALDVEVERAYDGMVVEFGK